MTQVICPDTQDDKLEQVTYSRTSVEKKAVQKSWKQRQAYKYLGQDTY